jgi:hypothetical protein
MKAEGNANRGGRGNKGPFYECENIVRKAIKQASVNA